MRGGIVAAGVVMMVLGALLFFGSFGSIGTQGFNGADLLSTAGFGVILGFIGFIVFIAGLAASQEPAHQPRESTPTYMGRDRGPLYADSPPVWTSSPVPSFPSAPPPPAPLAVPPQPSNAGGAGGAYCPFCGAPSKVEYKFCRKCGHEAPTE